ncbi:hypothetical protein HKD37_01G001497 [Glycine soja]
MKLSYARREEGACKACVMVSLVLLAECLVSTYLAGAIGDTTFLPSQHLSHWCYWRYRLHADAANGDTCLPPVEMAESTLANPFSLMTNTFFVATQHYSFGPFTVVSSSPSICNCSMLHVLLDAAKPATTRRVGLYHRHKFEHPLESNIGNSELLLVMFF